MSDYRRQAHWMVKHNLVPIPLAKDGTKLPKIKWKEFQTRYPSHQEIEKHFEDCGGVAALTLAGDPDNLTSDLFCLDFDLKYQLPHQDFFKDFGSKLPKEIKKKFLINATSSGVGRHVWFRTKNFHDKSRKLAYRLKTPEEIVEERDVILSEGRDLIYANQTVMKRPYKVIIETRGANSYGVMFHERYKRIYGTKLHYMNEEEMDIILSAAYETCEYFEKKEKYVGEVKHFNVIKRYNQDATPSDVMSLLSRTGMFKEVGTDYEGNITFLRHGSSARHSGKIFSDTSVTQVFSDNVHLLERGAYAPFEVYCAVNNLTKQKAINELQRIYT